MTKQEEIREGVALSLSLGMLKKDDAIDEDGELWTDDGYYFFTDSARERFANRVLQYLHSQGVVIKVDRECPSISSAVRCATKLGVFHITQLDMLEAGYVVVEPLIAETMIEEGYREMAEENKLIAEEFHGLQAEVLALIDKGITTNRGSFAK